MQPQTESTVSPSVSQAEDDADPVAVRPDASLWENCAELDADVTDIEGSLPEGLKGSLVRNGPAKRDLGTYFWDGDGMVRAVDFLEDGRIRYRAKYVQTPKYLAEREATQPHFRSGGTNRPGGILGNAFRFPESEANTHVIAYDGKLLACHEGGHPYRINPATLETEAHEHFGGALDKRTTFSAHPHPDPHTGDLYNFGFQGGPR